MKWTFRILGILFALLGFFDVLTRMLIEGEVPYEVNQGVLSLFGWTVASLLSFHLATRMPIPKTSWAKIMFIVVYVGIIAASMALLIYIDCAGVRCEPPNF